MRSLVKINDLEEQVESPLSKEIRALSSATYRGDTMDIEESVSLQEKARLAQHLSLGGGNKGTKVFIG